MKKSIKIFFKFLPVVIIVLVSLTNVYAGTGITPGITVGDSGADLAANQKVTDITAGIWSTIVIVVQIAAIAAIVIAGIRYMFASANDKADIKKQTIILVVGAILVFAASSIAGVIADVAKSLFGGAAAL